MIVLGADMHKQTHTVAVIAAATGELRGEKTVQVGDDGFLALLDWARALGEDRVWALEDCRHVSGSFERFLMASGERVVRVATKLMNDARRAGRERGKSDRIDALAIARAALREGIEALPSAQLAGVELEIRLLVDHRERLIRSRVALNNDLLWHLHDLWPELRLPGSALFSRKWSTRIARRLGARNRPRAFGSPATSCGGCANSPSPPMSLRPRSQTSSTRPRRSCSQSPASGH
jgi:transposase